MEDYRICRHLDEAPLIIIFTPDEFFGIALFGLIGFLMRNYIFGIIAGFLWVGGMKYLKKGKGIRFLFSILYWYIPNTLTRLFFHCFPASSNRHYLA